MMLVGYFFMFLIVGVNTLPHQKVKHKKYPVQQVAKPAASPLIVAPVLDLSDTIDFGSAAAKQNNTMLNFGGTDDKFFLDLDQKTIQSPEKKKFYQALGYMTEAEYMQAAMMFKLFLADSAYADFHQESQYQLAKALYHVGFFEASLKEFQLIIEAGPKHARYQKSVEWLFFVSQKIADQSSVLASLAKFRHVVFPVGYRYEYNYLIATYLFNQANNLEVKRVQEAELMQQKSSQSSTLDFGAIAQAIDKDTTNTLDFSKNTAVLDFSPPHQTSSMMDFSGNKQSLSKNIKEAISQALALLAQISKDSSYYPRAKYLTGLLHILSGNDQQAISVFQELVRVLHPHEGLIDDPVLREMAFLSLARTHYSHHQFDRSIYYYDMISRDSEYWLTALFESSWAYYRRDDFEKSLGNLLTLHAPYFEKDYFPESYLVKAIIYFESCRYSEARLIVDDFIKKFSQLVHALQHIVDMQESPLKLYQYIAKLEKESDSDTSLRITALMLKNQDIKKSRAILLQYEQEQKRLNRSDEVFQKSLLGMQLKQSLHESIDLQINKFGGVIHHVFEQELYQLKSLLGQALRIKIEVARAERENIESSLEGHAQDLHVSPNRVHANVDAQHIYWPYEGEYWRDELGSYEINFNMCRSALDH